MDGLDFRFFYELKKIDFRFSTDCTVEIFELSKYLSGGTPRPSSDPAQTRSSSTGLNFALESEAASTMA